MKIISVFPYHYCSFFLDLFNQLNNEDSGYMQINIRKKLKADLSTNVNETVHMHMEKYETSKI